jgi:hypothetical protein
MAAFTVNGQRREVAIDEPGSHSGFVAPRLLRFLAERL